MNRSQLCAWKIAFYNAWTQQGMAFKNRITGHGDAAS